MEYAILFAAIALIAWFVLQAGHTEGKRKHGFTPHDPGPGHRSHAAKVAVAKENISRFVGKNDLPIRDVLDDYRKTHNVKGDINLTHNLDSAVWWLGFPRVTREYSDPLTKTCSIEVRWAQNSRGKSCFQMPEIRVRKDAREAELLARALNNFVIRSTTHKICDWKLVDEV